MDASGSQYGFQDPLRPYHKYIDDGMCRVIREPQTYDASETTDLDYFATLPFLTGSKAQRSDLAAERRCRVCFADFVKGHVKQAILQGSDADFQNSLKKFETNLTERLLDLHTKKPI